MNQAEMFFMGIGSLVFGLAMVGGVYYLAKKKVFSRLRGKIGDQGQSQKK